ncbi:MAG TPA: NTP transferase domain-containing protein [Firmicutes bacterium]|nr:NTP transferase domain-containing protein [Bacillota bacterium]
MSTNQLTYGWWNPCSPTGEDSEREPSLVGLVLAAGQGKRMKSDLVKVLHPLRGRPLVTHVVDALEQAGVQRLIVVVGVQADLVRERLAASVQAEVPLEFVVQEQPLGTGHAVLAAEALLAGQSGDLLVVCGDTPLLTAADLLALVEVRRREKAVASFLTTFPPDPTGYGRVVRDEAGAVTRVVEESDCNSCERQIGEVNAGTYCFSLPRLWQVLHRVGRGNAQGEYYLTDAIAGLLHEGDRVVTLEVPWERVVGINDRAQLVAVEEGLRRRLLVEMMREGVTVMDPASVFVGEQVRAERDVVLEAGSVLEGEIHLAAGCRVGPFTLLRQVPRARKV